MEQEIIIEKAKAEWAHEFETEKQRLTDVLGKKVLGIEHIGSTYCSRPCCKTGARSDGRHQQSQRSFSSSVMSMYFTKPSRPGAFFEKECGGQAHTICTYTFFKAKNGKIS